MQTGQGKHQRKVLHWQMETASFLICTFREGPGAASNPEPENAASTASHNHEDPTITLPALPTWGSSTPLAAPVPSRPSEPGQNDEASTNGEGTSNGPATAPTENGIAQESTDDEAAASPSQDKGKAKAATVEDFIENVD